MPSSGRPQVVVVGGGVAALEAIMALRALAGPHVAITQLAPERRFAPPAASVASPFGFGDAPTLSLDEFAALQDVRLVRGLLGHVEPAERSIAPLAGTPIAYDHLVVAVGARRRAAVHGALTFRGPGEVDAVEQVLGEIAGGEDQRLVVAVPSTSTWPLPAYELAIMAAVELRSRGVADPDVAVVTPEPRPLQVFGEAAGDAMASLLSERGVRLLAGRRPTELAGRELRTAHGESIPADRVIALAESVGPYVPGLPHDALGFLPTDAHMRVRGVPGVYAAGDSTTFPLRQGGLAAQQADAAAEAIAVELGATATARPFRPVLRGVLLTGGVPLYLRTVVGDGETPIARHLRTGPSTAVGRRALWWPPAKVAGRYLAPLMATARPTPLAASPMQDVGYLDGAAAEDSEDALGLALVLADEDARCGDYRHALHALDAARALTGGVLPEAYAAKEQSWLGRV